MGRVLTVVIACLGATAVAAWLALPRVADVPATPADPVIGVTLAERVFAPTEAQPSVTTETPMGSVLVALPPTKENVERGAVLYTSLGCVTCHGVHAEGLVGPRIAGTLLGPGAVQAQVRTPRSHYMPAFPADRLSDEELAAIYAFLQGLPRD